MPTSDKLTDVGRELAEALAWRNEERRINDCETLLHHWMDMNNVIAALMRLCPDEMARVTSHHTVPIAERLKASDAAYHRVERAAVRLVRELRHEERRDALRAELLAADGGN
jgi:hypothetical protein